MNFISCANVAADVARMKMCVATWCVHTLPRGNTNVFAHVIREIKLPFPHNTISLYHL